MPAALIQEKLITQVTADDSRSLLKSGFVQEVMNSIRYRYTSLGTLSNSSFS